MATSTTDLISASRTLDPASRALLNLWLHRGLDDAAIAHLSGGSVEEVAERRRRLVDRLAETVRSPADEVRATLDGMAGGEAARAAVSQGEVEADAGAANGDGSGLVLLGKEPDDDGPRVLVVPDAVDDVPPSAPAALVLPGDPDTDRDARARELVVAGEPERPANPEIVLPATADIETEEDRAATPELVVPEHTSSAARRAAERERRREDGGARTEPPRASPFPAALGFALGTVIVVMVAVAALSGGSGGGGEESAATPSPSASATATATATPSATQAGPPPAPLEAVPGGPAGLRGTVRAQGDRVQVAVQGLDRPAADYQVWLFNSVADARSLGRLNRRSLRLPRDRARYRYLEVSLEPRSERAPAHSGRTVLRTAVPR